MKQPYMKPQVYRVKLEPEQAVLACCDISLYPKITDIGSGRCRCGGANAPGCGAIPSVTNALSS